MNYTIGTISANYPEAVQDLVNMTMRIATESGIIGKGSETDADILEEMLCKLALQKFLNGGDMYWDSEQEFVDACKLATVHSVIRSLQKEGLIDSIENEDGEEVVWVTDKGRALVSTIRE